MNGGTVSTTSSSVLQFGLDAVVEENPGRPSVAYPRGRSFNSASTLSSRRTGCAHGGADRGSPASIRPRRCRRGERRGPADTSAAVRALQFGLDAVVEENTAAKKRGRRASRVLQFGLDAVVEENPTFHVRDGNTPWPLQFGLDAVVEENVPDPAFRTRNVRLQFGLDAVVEENVGPPSPRRGTAWRFNSASTLSSRRTAKEARLAGETDTASIRPRRCRRGEHHSRPAAWMPLVRFNSASTLSSRRTARAVDVFSHRTVTLQFGLDAVVEENSRFGCSPHDP